MMSGAYPSRTFQIEYELSIVRLSISGFVMSLFALSSGTSGSLGRTARRFPSTEHRGKVIGLEHYSQDPYVHPTRFLVSSPTGLNTLSFS